MTAAVTKRGVDRTQECVMFLRSYIRQYGYSPSYEEIKASLGLRSKGSVSSILKKLADEGRVSYKPRQPRTLRII